MSVQTSLQGIAKKAESNKKHRFGNLFEMLNEEMLHDCWRFIRKDAAYGVDRVSAEEYEQNLVENIRQLVERLKRKSYRAKLVRRQYIPKEDGRMRPLGIPAVEDKLLQLAVKRILEAIYEQDFLRCSYGYRPNVGALNAVDKLTVKLQFGQYNYVVEASHLTVCIRTSAKAELGQARHWSNAFRLNASQSGRHSNHGVLHGLPDVYAHP